MESTIVFCRTGAAGVGLAEKMRADLLSVAVIADEMEVGQRSEVMKRFRDGFVKVLITTDVLSRELASGT
jgi:superfamily II DNA/RNA helicase